MIELIRKLIPTRIRIRAYVAIITLVRWNSLLLKIYLFLLHGHMMQGITIRGGKPVYQYKGTEIDSPKDSLEAYVEVFCENIYDVVVTPKDGDTVIDIGAYVGMFSIKASKFVGDSGLVVAVEPLPSNISYLERNTAPLTNVRVAKTALADYTGSARLYSSPSTAAHSMTYVRKDFTVVSVTTLDELVKSLGIKKVDYIKMDAEGSDINILLGAKKVLLRDSPILSMACYHTDKDGIPFVGKVIVFLQNMGYKCITKKGYIYAHKENLQ
jgi:FkbM family methyltransferase